MKILIICQHYWPEQFRITDIGESLVNKGCKVTVLCGLPNYPSGKISNDYKHHKNRVEIRNGVKILRVNEFPRRNNVFSRLINYYSYPYFATKYLKKNKIEFDVVLAIGLSPIMMVRPAIYLKNKYKCKIILYEMDLWPESLLAGGIKKNSLIYNYYKKISAQIYCKFDKILVTTNEHISYIKNLKHCENLDISYLPQYAESIFEDNDFNNDNNDLINLLFAGNIGKAQDVDTIINAASLLQNESKFKFHIVGDGSELSKVRRLANKLQVSNVTFYGQKPLDEMLAFYKLADVMLVTLDNKSFANITIPGKIQSYMAAGKPIIGAVNGSTANLIADNGIGFVCPSGDYQSLAALIKGLDLSVLKSLGKKSADIYFRNFRKEHFIDSLYNYLLVFADK